MSCLNTTIRGVNGKIVAVGDEVIGNSTIISAIDSSNDDSIMILEINGTTSDTFKLYCNSSNLCKIDCQSPNACSKLDLYCIGECFVRCDNSTGTLTACPNVIVGNWTEWVTISPTTYPTNNPTDTFNPTSQPSTMPIYLTSTITSTTTTTTKTIATTSSTSSTSATMNTNINNTADSTINYNRSSVTNSGIEDDNNGNDGLNELLIIVIIISCAVVVVVIALAIIVCLYFERKNKKQWKAKTEKRIRAEMQKMQSISGIVGTTENENTNIINIATGDSNSYNNNNTSINNIQSIEARVNQGSDLVQSLGQGEDINSDDASDESDIYGEGRNWKDEHGTKNSVTESVKTPSKGNKTQKFKTLKTAGDTIGDSMADTSRASIGQNMTMTKEGGEAQKNIVTVGDQTYAE